MKTTFHNEFNGHRRQVRGSTAFLGAFFLGPLYFAFKGAWPAFLVTGIVNFFALMALGGNPLLALFINALFVAPFAARIVRRHYASHGFQPLTFA